MITINVNLNEMTCYQIVMLDAALRGSKVPSKIKIEIVEAGEANCGVEEYNRIYESVLKFAGEVQ